MNKYVIGIIISFFTIAIVALYADQEKDIEKIDEKKADRATIILMLDHLKTKDMTQQKDLEKEVRRQHGINEQNAIRFEIMQKTIIEMLKKE